MAQETHLRPLRLVVVISGNGSNLQTIIDASQSDLAVEISAVISNRPQAYGLQRAENANITTHTLDHTKFSSREAFDTELKQIIDGHAPDLIVLAGFMRVLSNAFVHEYPGQILNIHPSLLPKYRGLNTHAKAIAAKDKYHGASVHFVTETLDGGPVIVQARVPILNDDNEESLAKRVQEQEHKIYIEALRWLSEGRLHWHDDALILDDQPLLQPIVINSEEANEAKIV
ncbi:MAG: phosphoribosylglycinamide formyltransferase [Gammaproteobacteria bacterium]|nr:phosphoribosylglycinamide formyltransferase [Gammaproteobacteria bacterium]